MLKRVKELFVAIAVCLCLAGCSGMTGETVESEYAKNGANQITTELQMQGVNAENSDLVNYGGTISNSDTLEVHYIDVGQGDSILIKQGEVSMLIDAGNNDKGTTVWSYLLSQEVDSLDYAICTHPDADHIGGMDVVLYKLDCDTVFMPACDHDTVTYKELIQTIGQRNQKVTVPKQGDTYSLGKAQFQILTDTEKNYGDNNNDYSIAIRLTFGEISFLFTGDAEEKAEQDMLDSGMPLSSDVYKVAHHGANTANTEGFLTVVNPTYAVISCGEENSYGHPRAAVLNSLRGMGVNVFRTDEQGTIVAVSDGENITFNCSPSTTWKAGEPTGSEKENESINDNLHVPEQENANYILNKKSKKIHLPTCDSVNQMSDKNREDSTQSKEELMSQGYEPCHNCNP